MVDRAGTLKALQEVLGRPDPIELARALVPPPTPLYIGRDDLLYIRARNAVAALTLTLTGRFLNPRGDVLPFNFPLAPAADRSAVLDTFSLGEGSLLSAGVFIASGTARRGQLFVEIGILRGIEAAAGVVQVLVKDYLTTGELLAFPGGAVRASVEGPGVLRSVAGTDPGVGVEITETVPTDARWRLLSMRFSLVTSGDAGLRRVHLVVDDGVTTLVELAAADTQTISLTRNYNCAPDGFARVAQDSEIYIPLPQELMLLQGFRLRTSTTAFDTAAPEDNFGAPQLLVEEWIED